MRKKDVQNQAFIYNKNSCNHLAKMANVVIFFNLDLLVQYSN